MTTGFPPLSFLILLPIVGALVCFGPWFVRDRDPQGRLCRTWSLAVSGLTLALLLAIAKAGSSEPGVTLAVSEVRPWLPELGISFSLLLDGLSFVFCLLTCIVTLAVIAWASKPKDAGPSWYALLLLGQASVLGAFLAVDLIVFYCFFEVMLLPVIAGMALWGGPRRLQAALTFLLYTIVASVPMLLAILYIGWKSVSSAGDHGDHALFAFDLMTLSTVPALSLDEQIVTGLAFLLAFAVKTPIVPMHGWLPETYREAPHGVAAFTAALLGKVGVYGLIRFMYPLFPDFMPLAAPYLAAAGAIGISYGAMVAMVQRDIRSLLAYSSVSHLGFCILGIGAATELAVTGAVFQAVSHGLVTAALFLIFGAIIDREGTRDMDSFGGLAAKIPVSAFFLMVFSIAAVALPLTSSFVGEFLVLIGSWKVFPGWTAVALIGVVLGAVYTLTAYLKTMFGPARERVGQFQAKDLGAGEIVVAGALAVAVLLLGIFPQGMLNTISPAVNFQLSNVAAAAARAQLDLEEVSEDEDGDEEELVDDISLSQSATGLGQEVKKTDSSL
jgi:NADH-quinone oxidoreductase subunit M